jgi:hypothetical protein
MKKVMLVILAGMFSMSMFAQTQEKTKPVEKKKEPAKTEAAKPVTKEEAKPATKDAAKPAAQPAQKKDDLKPKKK